jgi:hypothetical protein
MCHLLGIKSPIPKQFNYDTTMQWKGLYWKRLRKVKLINYYIYCKNRTLIDEDMI